MNRSELILIALLLCGACAAMAAAIHHLNLAMP